MELPNAGSAIVTTDKLRAYLLSDAHPVGQYKALFFKNLGYDEADADILRQDLLNIAAEQEISDSQQSVYGTKYIVDGPVRAPSGNAVSIRTVWLVESGTSEPRLVTDYPI